MKRRLHPNQLAANLRKATEAMRDVSPHTHPVVVELMNMMIDRRMTMTDMAVISGISSQAIGFWKDGISPKIVNVEAVAQVLGFRVALVPISPPVQDRAVKCALPRTPARAARSSADTPLPDAPGGNPSVSV